MSMLPPVIAQPQVQSGRIRALAIAGMKRSPLFPDVPTFAEAGFPDGALVPWYGLMLPRATPLAIIQQIDEALKSPEVRERLQKAGGELPAPMSLEELQQVADRATQIFGSIGGSDRLLIHHAYVYARSLRIGDGPDEAHLRQIFRTEQAPAWSSADSPYAIPSP